MVFLASALMLSPSFFIASFTFPQISAIPRFSIDLDDDFLSSIDGDLLDFVEGIEDLWFQFFDGGLNASTDIVSEFLGSSLDFSPDVFDSTFLHSEFIGR